MRAALGPYSGLRVAAFFRADTAGRHTMHQTHSDGAADRGRTDVTASPDAIFDLVAEVDVWVDDPRADRDDPGQAITDTEDAVPCAGARTIDRPTRVGRSDRPRS
jgi:hypothetical protein